MQVKIKKLCPEAVIPTYATGGDAGMDLYATSVEWDSYGNIVYGTGLAFEIPEGYYMDLRPRSSNVKKDLVMLNSPGTIDSGYRGEITAVFRPLVYGAKVYLKGDKIAQAIILPYPQIEFTEVDELSDTERGAGGYGSTGR